MNTSQKVAKLKSDIIKIKTSQLIGSSDSCSYLIVKDQVINFTGSWTSIVYLHFKSFEGKFFPKVTVYAKGYVNGSQVSSNKVIPTLMSQRSLFDYMTGESMQDPDECIFAISLAGGGGGNSWSGKLVVTVYADCEGQISWKTP